MLYPIKLENTLTKDNRIWFEDDGTTWWGKNEDNLQSAEGIELSSGYKVPGKIYVKDLSNAFNLGVSVGISIGKLKEKLSDLSYELNGDDF